MFFFFFFFSLIDIICIPALRPVTKKLANLTTLFACFLDVLRTGKIFSPVDKQNNHCGG